MITIDLRDKLVLNAERKPLFSDKQDATLHWYLATQIFALADVKGTAAKLVIWCWKVADNEPIVVDTEDFKLIKELVTDSKAVAIVKGQLLMALDDCKEASEK